MFIKCGFAYHPDNMERFPFADRIIPKKGFEESELITNKAVLFWLP